MSPNPLSIKQDIDVNEIIDIVDKKWHNDASIVEYDAG
jgi:hypothetical protein